MNNNFKEIKDKVEKIVKDACYSSDNKFTSTVWDYHILPVVRHSLNLGKKFKADLEVLELAALLHDYASLVNCDFYKEHHIYSAELAEKMLNKLGSSENKTSQVKSCILSHRGSVSKKRKTIEAKILASADAMSHITELLDMFYLTYGIHKYKTKEGAEWLKNKLERSWSKTMPEGKKIVKDDYEVALKIINKVLK